MVLFARSPTFNIIRLSTLSQSWEKQGDERADLLRIDDANGRTFELRASVWITVLFSNTRYKVKFLKADRISVELIVETEFFNRHVLAILCMKQRIRFRIGEIPIVKQLSGRTKEEVPPFSVKKWTETNTSKVKDEGDLKKEREEEGNPFRSRSVSYDNEKGL